MADADGATHLITEINVGKELEVSFVRRGSNPLSKVILKKSADEDPSQPENTDMLKSVAIAKALAAGGALAAYVESLTKEEDLDTFLAKDEAGRTADVTAFAKAKGMPMGDDSKAAANKADTETGEGAAEIVMGAPSDDAIAAAIAKALETSPVVTSLRKSLEDSTAALAKMQGEVTQATLEKRAATEFRGLGKSVEETVSILKALDGVTDAAARTAITDVLKAHAGLAGLIANTNGLRSLSKDASSATARLNKAAEDLAAAEKIDVEAAFRKVNNDPQYAELVAEADMEEREARAA